MLGLGLAAPAGAVVLNPSFETGDTSDWTTIGDVTVVTSSFGVTPTDATYQILLTTGSGSVSAASLESAMGLSSGWLDARLPEIAPKTKGTTVPEGSAFQQDIWLEGGDSLSWDWNFLTNEVVTEQTTSDFLFYDASTLEHGILAHARLQPSMFTSSSSSFTSETGWSSFSVTAPFSGTYTFTFGVADVEDAFTDSGAVFDNFVITKGPEPNTFLLLTFGLVGLAWASRRQNLGQRPPRR